MFFSSWLRSLKSTLNLGVARGRTSSRRRPCHRMPRLHVEALEDRTVPSLFGLQTPFLAGASPASVAVGYFNNDDIPDLAVANLTQNGTVNVLLGDGVGGFGQPTTVSTGVFLPTAVAVGDFNRDGSPDLAVIG